VDIEATTLNGGYISIGGTSASAAMVAGVAGFMKATDPTLANGAIVGRLARNADPAGYRSIS
jgi:subtilisin family serine protease